ncbi:MAG: hypothetical protein H6739_15220 [Alphaproteobacteria bacterium]|nr:hypothetical protein [Alphaproteobacteria bacterium]
MTAFTLAFEPLDLLMFRDHRPFDAGLSVNAKGRMPSPGTLYGAVRSALMRRAGADFRQYPDFGLTFDVRGWLGDGRGPGSLRLRGPLLVRGIGEAIEPVFPAPQDHAMPLRVAWAGQGLRFPSEEGSSPVLGSRIPWPREPWRFNKASSLDLLDLAGAQAWLAGGWGAVAEDNQHERDALLESEIRIGIARDTSRRVVAESMFYRVEKWRFHKGCGLAVEVDARDEAQEQALLALDGAQVPLGGKGHLARVAVTTAPLLGRVQRPLCTDGRARAWLLTPLVLGEDGLALPPGCTLSALFTTDELPTGGFDIARRRPRSLHATLPAGTVIDLEGVDDPAALARWTWGQAPHHACAGHGLTLIGGWTP